jgi:hypothetical protein
MSKGQIRLRDPSTIKNKIVPKYMVDDTTKIDISDKKDVSIKIIKEREIDTPIGNKKDDVDKRIEKITEEFQKNIVSEFQKLIDNFRRSDN